MNKLKYTVSKYMATFALLLGIGIFSASIPVYAASTSTDCSGSDGYTLNSSLGENCTRGKGTPTKLLGNDGIVTNVINIMLFIVGLLAVVMIIYAGIRYTTAHGDKNQVESAKNTMIQAIVGLIIAIIAYALVNWVVGLFVNDSK